MNDEEKSWTIKASVFSGLIVACPLLVYQIFLNKNNLLAGLFWAIIVAVILILITKKKLLNGKTKNEKVITDDKKKEILEVHFSYEVKSIKEIFEKEIFIPFDLKSKKLVKIRLINLDCGRYAFLLHIRTLHEFFYGKESKDNDTALVRHYLPNWKNKSIPNSIKTQYKLLHKFLAHLTYGRCDLKNDFRDLELYNHYIRLVIIFLNKLPKRKYMTPNLKKLLKDLKQESK